MVVAGGRLVREAKMKSCIFAPCYLDGNDDSGGSRLLRYHKFIDFYRPLKEELGFESFVFVDNASSWTNLQKLFPTVFEANTMRELRAGDPDLIVLRYDDFLGRTGVFGYPYIWRALYAVKKILKSFDRIIFIDSDGFVLTKRFAEWIRTRDSGWSAPWCEKYSFPEANVSVLCKDMFILFEVFCAGDWLQHNGKCFEQAIPFTRIERGFNVERYGEDDLPQRAEMDFYAQATLGRPLAFNRF